MPEFRALLDRFEEVCGAAERRLSAAAEVVRMLDTLSEVEKTRAAGLERLLQRLPAQLLGEATGISRLWTCETRWLEAGQRTAAEASQNARRLRDQLQIALDAADATRKRLSADGHASLKRLADSQHLLQKTKERYYKACKDADQAEAAAEMERRRAKATPGSIDGIEKRAGKIRAEALTLEQAYRTQVAATNYTQTEHYTSTMPLALDGFQQLFAQRTTDIARALAALAQLVHTQHDGVESQLRVAEDAASAVNAASENDEFATKLRTGFVPPPQNEFEPPPPASVMTPVGTPGISRKGGAATVPAMPLTSIATVTSNVPTTVFGIALQELMDRQRDSHPGLPIPYVLRFMAEGVLQLGAEKASGVFRVPGARIAIDNCRETMDSKGEPYVLLHDVNDAAGLLKTWLRALPSPVVPAELYEAAIATAGSDTPTAALVVLERMPEPNRSTLRFVAQLLKHLARDDVAKVTLMPRDNLASVFAPCLLGCPYQGDFRATLAAADKERAFIALLILGLPPDPTFASIKLLNNVDIPPPPPPPSSSASVDIPPPPVVDIPPPSVVNVDIPPPASTTITPLPVPPAPTRPAPPPPPTKQNSGPLKIPVLPSVLASSQPASEPLSPMSDRSSESTATTASTSSFPGRHHSRHHSKHAHRQHHSKTKHSQQQQQSRTSPPPPSDTDSADSDSDMPTSSAAVAAGCSHDMNRTGSAASRSVTPSPTPGDDCNDGVVKRDAAEDDAPLPPLPTTTV